MDRNAIEQKAIDVLATHLNVEELKILNESIWSRALNTRITKLYCELIKSLKDPHVKHAVSNITKECRKSIAQSDDNVLHWDIDFEYENNGKIEKFCLSRGPALDLQKALRKGHLDLILTKHHL